MNQPVATFGSREYWIRFTVTANNWIWSYVQRCQLNCYFFLENKKNLEVCIMAQLEKLSGRPRILNGAFPLSKAFYKSTIQLHSLAYLLPE